MAHYGYTRSSINQPPEFQHHKLRQSLTYPNRFPSVVTCSTLIPSPQALHFGMAVQMVTKKVRTDEEGTDVIAFFFRPA